MPERAASPADPPPEEPSRPAGPDGDSGHAPDTAEPSPQPVDTSPVDPAPDDAPPTDPVPLIDGQGQLDELSAALDADAGDEPRRHWVRYPGLFLAMAVLSVLIVLPCGAGLLFVTGGFADRGRYDDVPDACQVLTADQVRRHFGAGLRRAGHSRVGDSSSCRYRAGAAVGGTGRVQVVLTRYGTKGPLSAARIAHAGLADALSTDRDGAHPHRVTGIGDEAFRIRTGTGVRVYTRLSNVVLELDASGRRSGRHAVAAVRTAAVRLTH